MAQDDLKNFMKETFEFYSSIRAAEKDRFEVMQQFMVQITKIFQEISEDLKKSLKKMEKNQEDSKQLLLEGLESIKKTLGINNLEKSNELLQDIMDKFQRQSYLIEYKDTIKNLKLILNDLLKQPARKNTAIDGNRKKKTYNEIDSTKPKSSNIINTPKKIETGSFINRKMKNNKESPKKKISSAEIDNDEELEDEELPTFMKVNKDISTGSSLSSSKKESHQPRRAVRLKSIEKDEDIDEDE